MKTIWTLIFNILCIIAGVFVGETYATHSTICKQAVLNDLYNNAAYSKQLAQQMPTTQNEDFLTTLSKK